MKNTNLLGLGNIIALPSDASLDEKLGAMSALELEHGILGVSIQVESGRRVLARECIDDVLEATAAGIALMEHAETIPSLADLLERERRGEFEVPLILPLLARGLLYKTARKCRSSLFHILLKENPAKY